MTIQRRAALQYANQISDANLPILWHGKTMDASPEKRISREDSLGLVQYLSKMVGNGYRIVTWNGLQFDFDILAEESGDAAKSMGLPGKPEGMSGSQAPRLWADGHFKEVLEYVAQDCGVAVPG